MSTTTFKQALTLWKAWMRDTGGSTKTIHNYISTAETIFEGKFHGIDPNQIKWKELSGIANQGISDGVKKGTINNRITVIRSIWKFMLAEGIVKRDQSALVKARTRDMSLSQLERTGREAFTEDEIRRLLALLDRFPKRYGFWSFAVRLSLWTGLRLSDCARIRWECFTHQQGVITCYNSKTGKITRYPVNHPELHSDEFEEWYSMWVIKAMGASKPEDYIWPEAARVADSSSALLSVRFGRILKLLNINNKSFHLLRNTFSQKLLAKGVNVNSIQLWLAHESENMTGRYLVRN